MGGETFERMPKSYSYKLERDASGKAARNTKKNAFFSKK